MDVRAARRPRSGRRTRLHVSIALALPLIVLLLWMGIGLSAPRSLAARDNGGWVATPDEPWPPFTVHVRESTKQNVGGSRGWATEAWEYKLEYRSRYIWCLFISDVSGPQPKARVGSEKFWFEESCDERAAEATAFVPTMLESITRRGRTPPVPNGFIREWFQPANAPYWLDRNVVAGGDGEATATRTEEHASDAGQIAFVRQESLVYRRADGIPLLWTVTLNGDERERAEVLELTFLTPSPAP